MNPARSSGTAYAAELARSRYSKFCSFVALPTVVFDYRRVSLFLILSTALFALSIKPFSRAFRTVDSST